MDTPPAASSSSAPERRPLRDRLQQLSRRKNHARHGNNNNNNSNSNNTSTPATATATATTTIEDASDSVTPTSTPDASSSPPSSSCAAAAASSSATPSEAAKRAAAASSAESTFECNVCFDVPRDPVVTPCGHLYCWPCLYRWMKIHQDSPTCPVCKAGVDKSSVIPIYGRGRSAADDPRHRPLRPDVDADDDYLRASSSQPIPPRPQGHRLNPFHHHSRIGNNNNNNNNNQQGAGGAPNVPFGINAFTGGINAYAGNYEFSLGNFGNFAIFPSIFGFQMAYPNINDPHRAQDENREHLDDYPQILANIFLLLTLIAIAVITIF